MERILSIDPSGTGTTGIYFQNGQQETLSQHQGKDWQKHYNFIASLGLSHLAEYLSKIQYRWQKTLNPPPKRVDDTNTKKIS